LRQILSLQPKPFWYKTEVGRANSWAEGVFGKNVYVPRQIRRSKTVLEDVIANGVTSSGAKYALVNYADNFNPSKKNGPESVFAVQMSIAESFQNGNYGDALNFPMGNFCYLLRSVSAFV
jgi:hypothetical protein